MKIVRVGEISRQIRGVSYDKVEASKSPSNGLVPILRANNISDGEINLDDLVYVPSRRVKADQYLLAGDVLIAASSGSIDVVGKAAPVRHDLNTGFGAFCKVLRPNDQVWPSYFSHYFQTQHYRKLISGLAAGANINNLKNEHLDNLQIPLPPLPEQRRIAAILDAADALRAKRRAALAKLDALLQSVFLEMFGDPVRNERGWEIRNLGEVTRLVSGNSLPNGYDFKEQQGGFFLVKVSDMNIPGNETFITKANSWLPERVKGGVFCNAGAVIIPKRGGAIGTNKKRILTRPAYLDPNVMGIEPFDGLITSWYLFSWFQRFDLLTLISGTSVPQLNKQDLDPLPIPIPPLELQLRFDAVIERVQQLSTNMRSLESHQNSLFLTLQYRAFRGKLFD